MLTFNVKVMIFSDRFRCFLRFFDGILELFRQCGIFWNCFDSVVYFGTVPTVWYILFFILFPHSLPNSRTAVWFWSLMTFILFWFSLVLIRKKTFEEELITKHPEERCFFRTWRLLYQHSLNSFLSLLCLVLIVILCEPMNSFLLCLSFLWNEIKNGPMKK